jgi:formamidopyrimidine-DNA glycosylase
MPELPEVETVRAGLAQHLVGAVINEARVFDARSLKKNFAGAEGFLGEAKGARLSAVVRRGKFLWLPVSNTRALVAHLGMSGQILVRTPDFPEDKQTRVMLEVVTQTGDHLEIRFVDQRLFGGLVFEDLIETSDSGPSGFSPEADPGNLIPTNVSHIARDLLDPMFDADMVASKMTKKNSGIKRVLLDQNLMSGIGNIYADESLWLAKLHYDQPAASITKRKHLELIQIAKEVLDKAVAQGGTSFDEQYKNVNGESGYFSQSLNAYGQTGLPCKRCGKPIKREAWANRGSHFCPSCQRLRSAKR